MDDGSSFAQWRALGERLNRERPDALIVWVADNVADATFLAMACDRLAGRREPLWRVQVPAVELRALNAGSAPTQRLSHVATHSPQQLAQLFAARVLVGDAFFAMRLIALIEAGRIETSGPQSRVLDCSVRRAAR